MTHSLNKKRILPIGAEILEEGVHFRIWAPQRKKVNVVLEFKDKSPQKLALIAEGNGYFSNLIPEAKENSLYKLQLDDKKDLYADPASRFQPMGPHGPSQVINPHCFRWHDGLWSGIDKQQAIIYEMHVGTFTFEGTWLSAAKQLKELAKLGITVIQMMPIAEFPGEFGWGYDGVNLFAPMHVYGTPDDLRYFINEAHQLGLGVILDVVYNHLGPEGNYLDKFYNTIFSRKITEWGLSLNFEEDAEANREFFKTNASYWISEFHFDGLRMDATQDIQDRTQPHIIKEIAACVHKAAQGKSVYLVAENEPQNKQLIIPPSEGGYGLDALLNDDFHHSAMVCLTGNKEAYYRDYTGSVQEILSCLKYAFLYQGQWYAWQNKNRGKPTFGLKPSLFINFLQNHDQIANSSIGKRLHLLTDPGLYRALTGILLLAPQTPLLFQGQEFCSSAPFQYFADHKGVLAEEVAKGRIDFLTQFPRIKTPEIIASLPEPHQIQTFEQCKLDHNERYKNEKIYNLHQDLIYLRKNDPIFKYSDSFDIDGAVIDSTVLIIRYFAKGDCLLVLNLGSDKSLEPSSEPLAAPPENRQWQLYWSSEDPRYGGNGMIRPAPNCRWQIPAHSLMVLIPTKANV